MSKTPLKRKTFAIISHPDAGKTTLTEKLLLGGGAIHTAGEVKARGAQRHAHSDWMEMEQKRGISVTSSVMTYTYRDTIFNLLDTPGHKDFSEDTYRTLTAVDSAIMVLDAAKGIESQTLKLFEVCRLRDVPIMTFINKMDRETKDPFDLLDEIETTLALDVCPMTWPVGMGKQFRGCYHIYSNHFQPFSDSENKSTQAVSVTGPDDPTLRQWISEEQQNDLVFHIGLLQESGKQFDATSYLEGHLTPVYFGSALRNFGVVDLLNGLHDYAPTPSSQKTTTRDVLATENQVTGFVFKIQANMDPNHRDRIAFVRICSGVFKRGMKLKHIRTDKTLAIQNPVFFLAQERSLAEESHAGDIIGIPNHGTMRIGDTLSEKEPLQFTGIPNFAPEILKRTRLGDPLKIKSLKKALQDLSEEGISQLFRFINGSDWVIGVVGQLQLDVLISRMQAEYNVSVSFENAPYNIVRWVSSDDNAALEDFVKQHKNQIAKDIDGCLVFFTSSQWDLDYVIKQSPKIKFTAIREQHLNGDDQEAVA